VAYQLINNELPASRTRRSGLSTVDIDSEYIDELNSHHLKALIDLPHYAPARERDSRARGLCGECNTKATFYCVKCLPGR
ncbi:hypothetical protein F443_19398, partial [Phytophthora nicotianae P1569]